MECLVEGTSTSGGLRSEEGGREGGGGGERAGEGERKTKSDGRERERGVEGTRKGGRGDGWREGKKEGHVPSVMS